MQFHPISHKMVCPNLLCQEDDKECIGCSPCPMPPSRPTFLRESCGSVDSSNSHYPSSYTGSSSSPLPRNSLLERLESCSETSMQSSPKAKQQKTTYGKKTPAFPERNSSLGPSLWTGPLPKTGSSFAQAQNLATWMTRPFPQMFLYDITVPCDELLQTTLLQLRWSEAVLSCGALLVQGRVEELGKKPVQQLLLKIQEPNGGVVTEVNQTLLSMNFEVQSTYRTYSGGWIVIHVLWKPKAGPCHCLFLNSGSPQICTQANGTKK